MSLIPYPYERRHVSAAERIQAAFRTYNRAKKFYNSATGQALKRAAGSAYDYLPEVKKLRMWTPPIGRRYKLGNVQKGVGVGMEKKFNNNELDLNPISITITGAEADPTTLCLNAIGQGDGENQRDGRKYTMLSVHLRGSILFQQTAASVQTADWVRILLVLDTQTNAAQFNAEDVLDDNFTDADLKITAFRNLEYTSRFKVLAERTVRKPAAMAYNGTNMLGMNASVPWKIDRNFKGGIPVLCTGTAGTVANIVDNSLHILAISVNSGNLLRYCSRVRFVG